MLQADNRIKDLERELEDVREATDQTADKLRDQIKDLQKQLEDAKKV